VENGNLDLLFTLRRLTASSKARMNEDVILFIVSHLFSPKFLFKNSVSEAGVMKLGFQELCGIEQAKSFLKTCF
jgi:hypothetical protein